MNKTSEVQPNPNGEPSPEKDNLFTKAARKLGEVALYAWGVVTGKGSGKQTEDISGTIAPEAPVESGNTPAALIEPTKPTSSDIHGDERWGFVGGAAANYLNSVKPSTSEEQASDSTEDASGSSAEKNIPVSEPPEPTSDELDEIKRKDKARAAATKDSSSVKPSAPEKPVDVSENEPKYYSLDDLIYGDVPKSKADEILKNAYGTAHEPKTLDELIDNPNISKDEVDEILDRVYGSSSEKNDRKDGANSTKGSQESGAAESSKDKQTKDSNSNAGEAQVKEISPEEHKAAASLKLARERFAKASIAVESHFFGKKKRQEELNAAAEELKKCKLGYMRLEFADKIEAAKQDPEKQAELAAEMAQAAFASMQETSRTTTDKYDSMLDDRGKFKKAVAKVGKWFNKGGKIAQWLKLGGAGFAVGATTAAFAGWPITVAVGVVTKLGVAGATKQAVLEEHRGEDRIDADASLGTIDPSFEKAVANMKIDDVMEHAVNVSVDNLKDVSIERRDALRKKVLSSSGKYAVGLVLGGLAGKYVGDWANDSASQSGGKELKAHLLEKANNTKPGSANPVGNYTPGLDSLYGYDPSKHEFLWQWAESVYGEGNGTSGIMHTVDVLRDNGYIVDIINNPNGSFSVVVDGVSDTKGLVEIFSQFVN